MSRPPAWIVVGVGYLYVSMTMLAAVRPMVSYRALELGASATAVGVIAGAYAIVALVMAVPLGKVADRFGPVPLMIGGAFGLAISALAIALVRNLALLAVSQALLGLAFLTVQVGQQTLFATVVPARSRDTVFGTLGVVGSLGQMAGPLVAGVVVAGAVNGLDRVFYFGAGLALVATAMASGILPSLRATRSYGRAGRHGPSTEDPGPAEGNLPAGTLGILRIRGVPRALFVGLAVMASIDVLVVYLPVYGEANDIPIAVITTLLAIRAGTSMLSRAAMSIMVSRLGRKSLLVIGTIAPGIALALLPFTTHVPTLIVLIAITGFFLGIGQPLTLVWVINQVPPAVRGAALGLRMSGNKLVQLIVPVAIGAIAGSFGVGLAFLIIGAILTGSAATLRGLAIEDPQ